MAERKGPDPRILKLLAAAREKHIQFGELLDEIDAIVDGKASIAVKLKDAERAFDRAWCSRYAPTSSAAYVWRYQIDRPNLKRLLKAMEPGELAARAISYISDSDPFLVKARHPFGLFVSRINQYAHAPAEDFRLAPVADCQHTPPCKSDQEHTRRKLEEVRA